MIWSSFEEYCLRTGNEGVLQAIGHMAREARLIGSHPIGKLGFKEEAAGKIRVFAMVDCWTQ